MANAGDDVTYGFSASDVQRIDNVVSFVEHETKFAVRRERLWPKGGSGGSGIIEGRCISGIRRAEHGLTGATTFTFVQWIVDDRNEAPVTLKEQKNSDDELIEQIGVNRDVNLSAGEDAYLVLGRVNGEWRPLYVGEVC